MLARARPLLVVPLLLAACASSKVAPAPVAPPVVKPKPAEPPEVARWAALTEDLATELRTAGAACGGVALAMTTFVDAHQTELRSAFTALAAWEKATAEHLVARFYDKHFAAIEVRIDAGIRCQHDKPTAAAYDRFFAAAGLDLR